MLWTLWRNFRLPNGLEKYAAGPEMVCPGGALFFQPLGPEIPSTDNLATLVPSGCYLVHTVRKRRASVRAGTPAPPETRPIYVPNGPVPQEACAGSVADLLTGGLRIKCA